MSGSAYITTRQRKVGKRYVVRYRLGGRYCPVVHAGSFKTMREAKLRRDFVAGELAAGHDPAERLSGGQPEATPSLAAHYAAWKTSRLDLDERTLANCDMHWKRLAPAFGHLTADKVTHTHVQEWIHNNAGGDKPLTPRVLRNYLGTMKQVLDYVGLDPNPARDRRIRYPTAERVIPVPPSDKHVLAMLEQIPAERRLVYVFLEQDGGRLGEHIAFTWGDVDVGSSRIIARPQAVKGRSGRRKARWVQVAEWLMEILLDTCPPEDRTPERALFPWLRRMEHPRQAANKTMRTACKAAGIPHFHPHDLRHRRCSLWHGQGIPAREIGERVGQQQIAVTLDTYTHVMPLDEVPTERLRALLAAGTPPREVPVRSQRA